MRFANPSSTDTGQGWSPALVAGVLFAAVGGLIALLARDVSASLVGVGFASLSAVLIVFHLLAAERQRHEVAEGVLHGQAVFLEALLASFGEIAATVEPDQILSRTCSEAERLFRARVAFLAPGESRPAASAEHAVLIPMRIRGEEIGGLRLVRDTDFDRDEVALATLFADVASRVYDNAQLRREAEAREAERSRLSDQLITAEQDERRRLALFLHDTAVQSLSGIALMLDAGLQAVEAGDLDQGTSVISSALERHRKTIGSVRDLSFNLEPVVLRDQGFGPAVRALAEQFGLANEIQIDVALDGTEALAEQVQVALYQIVREALNGAVRRSPARVGVRVYRGHDGRCEARVSDDGREERRRAFFDGLAERARTLNGTLAVDQGSDGGTSVTVVLPASTAER